MLHFVGYGAGPTLPQHFIFGIPIMFENENCDGWLVTVTELMELSTVGVGDTLSPTDREVFFYSLHSWSSATFFPPRESIGTTDVFSLSFVLWMGLFSHLKMLKPGKI